jgi:curved DNA-binding protein CbpA
VVFDETGTYYDVLDVRPDANPEELREAYLRAKTAYSKDSVALYTLVDADEMKETLSKIEEAYMVLSNPQRRKEYDHKFGFIDPNEELVTHRKTEPPRKIISIDRLPPMDQSQAADELLIPPATDFGSSVSPKSEPVTFPGSADEPDPLVSPPALESTTRTQYKAPTRQTEPEKYPEPARPYSTRDPRAPASSYTNVQTESPPKFHAAAHAHLAVPDPRQNAGDSAIVEEISAQTEWRGPFLRKVRESMRLSLEEMSTATKISKTYLTAIEDENFVKLPAPVYVRGFVMQIARILKLPTEQVVNTYLDRYKQLKIR